MDSMAEGDLSLFEDKSSSCNLLKEENQDGVESNPKLAALNFFNEFSTEISIGSSENVFPRKSSDVSEFCKFISTGNDDKLQEAQLRSCRDEVRASSEGKVMTALPSIKSSFIEGQALRMHEKSVRPTPVKSILPVTTPRSNVR